MATSRLVRGACYINYWRSMFLAERDGVIFLSQFLLQLKVCANRYLLPQGVRILHLHSQWAMHFKSLERAAVFTRYCWDLLRQGSVCRFIGVKLCGLWNNSSHEYLYASFAPYHFSKICFRSDKTLSYFPYVLIKDRIKMCWVKHLEQWDKL